MPRTKGNTTKDGKGSSKRPRTEPNLVRGSSSRGGASLENERVDPRFINEKAQNVYNKVLRQEVLLPSMKFHWSNIMESGFAELFEDFKEKGIYDVLGYENDIYEDLVREFYANMRVTMNNPEKIGIVLSTSVAEKSIVVNEDNLCSWFGIPREGVRPTCSNDDKSKSKEHGSDNSSEEDEEQAWTFNLEMGIARLQDLKVVRSTHTMEAMDLPIKYRLLHYAINRNLFPKKASNNYITNLDVEIIWHLEEGRRINFAHLILLMMLRKYNLLIGELYSSSVKHKGMPYATIITRILREHGVDLSRYTSTPFPHNWRVTTMNLKTMRLVKTVEHGWMYGPHAHTLGLTPVDEGTVFPEAVHRHSSARRSNVERGDLESVRRELGEIRTELREILERLSTLERLVQKVSDVVDKIFDAVSCRRDDIARP